MINYQKVKLSDVCQVESGGTPSSSNPSYWNGDINWATLVDVKNKYITSTKRKITAAGLKNSSAKLLPIRTVLFSSRATIGEVSITNIELATNQGFKNFICNEAKILPEYLYYVLKNEAENIEKSAPSTTFKEVSKTTLSNYKISLPPLDEQEKIVNKLDLAYVLREKRTLSNQLLDEYIKSIFLEMFGDPVTNPKKWPVKKLRDVCVKITDGTHHSPPIIKEGVPYVTAKHVRENKVDFFKNPTFISEKDHQGIYSRCAPTRGDVLYIKDGATTGVAAVNEYDFEFSMLSSLALLKPTLSTLNPYYLVSWLNNKDIKEILIRNMAGAAIKRFTLTKINEFEINMPPVELQNKYADKLIEIENLKQKMSVQAKELDNQFQALMQKSFLQN